MPNKYWFPAKTFGWGWGLPSSWQGRAVFAAYVGLMIAGPFVFPPRATPFGYGAYVAVLSALLVAVCWFKGEPPRWRWGS
jgi:hypothetical protein